MATILVVDDEFGIPDVMAAVLGDEGYRVVTAANGRQGLDRAARERPDLVILDLMMPIMDGCAMLEAMRADPDLRDIPVLMISGLSEEAVRARCQGYAAFLRKPFYFPDLVRVLDALLGPGGRPPG
jgi:CheY-like chemotaxis protein